MAEITVIVPVYKVENYIRRCIDSILCQSFADFELILVDDGSPDKCPEICDSYAEKDARISVIHQKNGGAASARNSGLDSAEGKWLAFVDSDDWIHPDYLKLLHDTAVKMDADVVAGRYKLVNAEGSKDHTPEIPLLSKEDLEDYWVNDRIGAVVPWGKLYLRELFEGLRYPVGRTAEDEYVTYKVLFGCKNLVVLENILYFYYVNTGSVSRNNYVQRLPDILEAFELHEAFFKDSPWKKVYRLETEYHAASWSDAIWITKNNKDKESKRQTKEFRRELKQYLKEHKAMIPVAKRKDIYIAAYPQHELFIRGYGLLKRMIKHE